MIPYIIIYLLLFLLSFKVKKDKWNYIDYIFLIIMICFSGFRYGIGSDYHLYRRIYEFSAYNLSRTPTNRTGIGFSYLCYFFNKIGFSYQFFVFFISAITIICFYIFIKKKATTPGRAILAFISLGFYTSTFNTFRQMLSVGILLMAFIAFQNKKKIASLLLATCSFFFHSSSLYGILLYLIIYKFKDKKINFMIVYPIAIVISLFYEQIFSRIMVYFEQYSSYLTYESTHGIGTYLMVFFYLSITLFIILYNRKRILAVNKNNNYMINLLIVGDIIMLFQLKNWLFARLAVYSTIFVPILLSEYYDTVKLEKKKGLSMLFYLVLLGYFIMYTMSFGGVVPYNTIFG